MLARDRDLVEGSVDREPSGAVSLNNQSFGRPIAWQCTNSKADSPRLALEQFCTVWLHLVGKATNCSRLVMPYSMYISKHGPYIPDTVNSGCLSPQTLIATVAICSKRCQCMAYGNVDYHCMLIIDDGDQSSDLLAKYMQPFAIRLQSNNILLICNKREASRVIHHHCIPSYD